jgi:hypothetical protein
MLKSFQGRVVRISGAVLCGFLLATVLAVVGATSPAGAAVSTNQADYSPGSTVTISGDNSDGSGWLSGETVNVAVNGPVGFTASCSDVVDGTGSWSCQITLPTTMAAIGMYSYTATGGTSGTSEGGTFLDSACQNGNAIGNDKPSNDGLQASYTDNGGGHASYSFTSNNETPSGGVPGLIEYCVYTGTLPNSPSASYSGWNAGVESNKGEFNFGRPNGNPTNIPFDGTTQAVGTAVWNSGTVPTDQTIVLHINDADECSALYGGGTVTCYVYPSPPTPPAASALTASKTATGTFNRAFTWQVDKSVDHSEITAPSGSATFNYTVTVTKSGPTDSGWAATGTITVTDPNNDPVTGVDITDAINDPNASCNVTGGNNATVDNGTTAFDYTCTYSAAPQSTSETNTATIDWPTQTLSPSGAALTGGSTTATASVDLSNPTNVTDNCVTVGDTLAGPLGSTCASHTYTYPLTLSGTAGTCTPYLNTASITTSDSDAVFDAGASAEVCVPAALKVSKTATPTFTRTYNWSIDKTADSPIINKPGGGTVTAGFTVTVTQAGHTDSGWQVSGAITVENPNDFEAITASVSDAVDNGGSCLVEGSAADTVTIPASGSKVLDYTCTYASAPSPDAGTNTATATWDGAGSPATGTANFTFDTGATGNPTEVNKCVTVTDTFNGGSATTLGTDCVGTDPVTKTFTYSESVTAPAPVTIGGTSIVKGFKINQTQVSFLIPSAGKWQLSLWSNGTQEGRASGTQGTLSVSVPTIGGCKFQIDVKRNNKMFMSTRIAIAGCGGIPNCLTYPNIATLVETNQSSNASVEACGVGEEGASSKK